MKRDERELRPQWLFHDMHKAHRHATRELLKKYDFKDPGQPRVLGVLKDYGEDGVFATQRELADMVHVAPSTMTATLKYLEKRDYIEKLHDKMDLRRNKIALTQKGMDVAYHFGEDLEAVDRAMFKGFSENEEKIVSEYFIRIINNLDEYAKSGNNTQERDECF